MARVTINETILDDISDSIRNKLGVNTEYAPQDMSQAIDSISGQDLMVGNIVANGEYTPTGGKNGFSKVVVNVPSDSSTLVDKTITQNGTYDPIDDNADGYSQVVVNVPSGGGTSEFLTPDYYGLSYGYILSGNWTGGNEKNMCVNLYAVNAGEQLCLFAPDNASRCRIAFFSNHSANDFYQTIDNARSGVVYAGNSINDDDRSTYRKTRYIYTPSTNGVIVVFTSNQGTLVPAYCINLST